LVLLQHACDNKGVREYPDATDGGATGLFILLLYQPINHIRHLPYNYRNREALYLPVAKFNKAEKAKSRIFA
jgi:hypothetical protein